MNRLTPIASVFALVGTAGVASAANTLITVYPNQVPDEEQPASNLGDAPAGYGPDSWGDTPSGLAGDKVNWHARYLSDGNALTALFGSQAATLTVNDLADIRYSGKATSEHWFVKVYTRPGDGEYSSTGAGDQASWFRHALTNDYGTITEDGTWQQWSLAGGGSFDLDNRNGQGSGTDWLDLAEIKAAYGTELIEMISIQTDGGLGTAGFMDGLEIELTNGDIGRVDFAVPEPASLALLAMGAGAALLRRSRNRTA